VSERAATAGNGAVALSVPGAGATVVLSCEAALATATGVVLDRAQERVTLRNVLAGAGGTAGTPGGASGEASRGGAAGARGRGGPDRTALAVGITTAVVLIAGAVAVGVWFATSPADAALGGAVVQP
jgi:hypothetical protein